MIPALFSQSQQDDLVPPDRSPVIGQRSPLLLVLPAILYAVRSHDAIVLPGEIEFLFLVAPVQQTDSGIASLQRPDENLEVILQAHPIALLPQGVLVDGDGIAIGQNSRSGSRHIAEIVAGQQ